MLASGMSFDGSPSKKRSTRAKYITASCQSNGPFCEPQPLSQVGVTTEFTPPCPSGTVLGFCGSVTHCEPLRTNLYCTGRPLGSGSDTVNALPLRAIGTPCCQPLGAKSPRSSTVM